MNKKMFWIGSVILISGIVITIIGVLGISRLNGFYGLSLYYSNFSLYGEEYTLFSILLYWGIGFIKVGRHEKSWRWITAT
jgi:multisubunit Na+/H+ antiporter MnhG subunit